MSVMLTFFFSAGSYAKSKSLADEMISSTDLSNAHFRTNRNIVYYTPNQDDINNLIPLVSTKRYINNIIFNTEVPSNIFDKTTFEYSTLYNNKKVIHKINTFLWLSVIGYPKSITVSGSTNPPDSSSYLLNAINTTFTNHPKSYLYKVSLNNNKWHVYYKDLNHNNKNEELVYNIDGKTLAQS